MEEAKILLKERKNERKLKTLLLKLIKMKRNQKHVASMGGIEI